MISKSDSVSIENFNFCFLYLLLCVNNLLFHGANVVSVFAESATVRQAFAAAGLVINVLI